MAGAVTLPARGVFSTRSESTRAVTESTAVRWILTGIALLFLGVFIFMPLAVVFVEALRKGLSVYWDEIGRRKRRSAAHCRFVIDLAAVSSLVRSLPTLRMSLRA